MPKKKVKLVPDISANPIDLQAKIATCDSIVQEYIVNLETANTKFQKQIIKLEAQNRSYKSKIALLEKEIDKNTNKPDLISPGRIGDPKRYEINHGNPT